MSIHWTFKPVSSKIEKAHKGQANTAERKAKRRSLRGSFSERQVHFKTYRYLQKKAELKAKKAAEAYLEKQRELKRKEDEEWRKRYGW